MPVSTTSQSDGSPQQIALTSKARGEKIPATVITGFLGAGKTTLIRHLLSQANGRRLALIINEFGDLGIDGSVLQACDDAACGEDDIFELANGCICCTVADDFLPTIQKILDRPEPPDHIIIETSGLAMPKPLVKAFNWPDVRAQVTVDGVITMVDAPAVVSGQFVTDPAAVAAQRLADDNLDHESPLEELFEEQMGSADLVVINKTDILPESADAELNAMLQPHMRAGVKVVRASHGTVALEVALGLHAAAEDDLDSRPSHHDGADDDHDHDDFDSFVLTLPEIGKPETLIAALQDLVQREDILRVKGFAAVSGRDMRLIVQGVGPRFQHYYDRDWRPEESRQTRMVIIGQKGLASVQSRADDFLRMALKNV